MKKSKLVKFLALALALIMVTGTLAGCSSSSSGGNKVVRAIVGGEPRFLDPGLNNANDGGMYIDHQFEGLTREDKDGNIVAGIAKSWKISDDQKTYTFTLRDAKWSDGQEIKASDFVYAWKRVLDPAVASEYAYLVSDYIVGGKEYNEYDVTTGSQEELQKLKDQVAIKATDDKTLEVQILAPTVYFLQLMAFTTYKPVRQDIIEKYGDTWVKTPESYIGNGPFKMKESRGDGLTLVKNDKYWDAKNIKLDGIEFIYQDDDAAALNASESGEIDVNYEHVPPAEIARLKKDAKWGQIIYPNLATYFYDLNTKTKPLDDVRVRKALSLAIDRTYVVEKAAMAGQLPAKAFIPEGIAGTKKTFREEYDPLISPTADVEQAKQLLAEAGYPDGKGFPSFELSYNTNDLHKAVAEAIQNMWKVNLGIEVKLQNMDFPTLQDKRNTKNYDIARDGWTSDYNDPMSFMFFGSTNGNNNTNWGDPAYDAAVLKANTSADPKERMDAMAEGEKILLDQAVVIPIFTYVEKVLIDRDKVADVFVSPLGKVNLTFSSIK